MVNHTKLTTSSKRPSAVLKDSSNVEKVQVDGENVKKSKVASVIPNKTVSNVTSTSKNTTRTTTETTHISATPPQINTIIPIKPITTIDSGGNKTTSSPPSEMPTTTTSTISSITPTQLSQMSINSLHVTPGQPKSTLHRTFSNAGNAYVYGTLNGKKKSATTTTPTVESDIQLNGKNLKNGTTTMKLFSSKVTSKSSALAGQIMNDEINASGEEYDQETKLKKMIQELGKEGISKLLSIVIKDETLSEDIKLVTMKGMSNGIAVSDRAVNLVDLVTNGLNRSGVGHGVVIDINSPDGISRILNRGKIKMLLLKCQDPNRGYRYIEKYLREYGNGILKESQITELKTVYKSWLRRGRYDIRTRLIDLSNWILKQCNDAAFTNYDLFDHEIKTTEMEMEGIGLGLEQQNNSTTMIDVDEQEVEQEHWKSFQPPIDAQEKQVEEAEVEIETANSIQQPVIDSIGDVQDTTSSNDETAPETLQLPITVTIGDKIIPLWKLPTVEQIAQLCRHEYRAKVNAIFAFLQTSHEDELSDRSLAWVKHWIRSYALLLLTDLHDRQFYPHKYANEINKAEKIAADKHILAQGFELDDILEHVYVKVWDGDQEDHNDIFNAHQPLEEQEESDFSQSTGGESQ